MLLKMISLFKFIKKLNIFKKSSEELNSLLKCLDLINDQIPSYFNQIFFNYFSYAQEGEDLILKDVLNYKNGFYLDVGAHHPYRFSVTSYFYQKGWQGINIDPNPGTKKMFDRERPGDINLEIGISNKNEELTLYVFDEPALSTFDKKRSEKLEKTTAFRIVQSKIIPVERLDNVISKYAPDRKIDLLNIDVEMFEMDVLKSNDWNRYRPKILAIELLNVDINNMNSSAVHRFLKKNRYGLFAKSLRTCFYKDMDNNIVDLKNWTTDKSLSI